MNVRALHILLSSHPALHVDVAHLLTGEKRIVLQYHIVCIPYDAAQLITDVTNKQKCYTAPQSHYPPGNHHASHF